MSGLKIDDSNFQTAIKAVNGQTRANVLRFAKTAASTFQQTARSAAPWVNRRGVARPRLYGRAAQSGDKTTIEIGGSAPNYKPYKDARKRYDDYMELLEFANGGEYGVVFPLRSEMITEIRKKFGAAALKGVGSIKISRSKAAMRIRKQEHRARGGK